MQRGLDEARQRADGSKLQRRAERSRRGLGCKEAGIVDTQTTYQTSSSSSMYVSCGAIVDVGIIGRETERWSIRGEFGVFGDIVSGR